MTVTKKQIDAWLFMARENIKDGNDEMEENVIVALADQRDELVALLRDGDTGCDGSDGGDDDPPCWGCRASALLARIGVTS